MLREGHYLRTGLIWGGGGGGPYFVCYKGGRYVFFMIHKKIPAEAWKAHKFCMWEPRDSSCHSKLAGLSTIYAAISGKIYQYT